MRRKPGSRTTKLAALGLEVAGVGAVLAALAMVNIWLALALAGIVLVAAAQFVEELL